MGRCVINDGPMSLVTMTVSDRHGVTRVLLELEVLVICEIVLKLMLSLCMVGGNADG